jgi:hypothetical protein
VRAVLGQYLVRAATTLSDVSPNAERRTPRSEASPVVPSSEYWPTLAKSLAGIDCSGAKQALSELPRLSPAASSASIGRRSADHRSALRAPGIGALLPTTSRCERSAGPTLFRKDPA